jgi:dTDP-4-amino-4,6-dideoxygalactose transaminase
LISNFNYSEKGAFLRDTSLRDVSSFSFLYPALRQGLYQFFKTKSYKKVLLPEYLPEGIYAPFKKLNFEIQFYTVDRNTNIKAENIKTLISDFKPDVIVYIHLFGLRNQKNIDLLTTEIKSSAILLVEDFAHTIPAKENPVIGDVLTMSFTKIIGVSQGSLLWIKNKGLFFKSPYLESKEDLVLRKKMDFNFKLLNYMSGKGNVFFSKSIILKLLKSQRDYYSYLMDRFHILTGKVSDQNIEIINKIDFEKIHKRRNEIATMYLNKLNPGLLMDLPQSYYTGQLLFAFPILVDDQNKFGKYIRNNGISGVVLTNKWWFSNKNYNELYQRHFLLPINHYLSNNEIEKVIDFANKYIG